MIQKHSTVLLLALLAATLVAPAEAQPSPSSTAVEARGPATWTVLGTPEWDAVVASFTRRLAADVEGDAIGGLAAGIVVDGDLVWARGFGWSDREGSVPMAPSAVSRTGSISKSVTALLLLRLVDSGVVALDDPVERYLPEFAAVTNAHAGADVVTLRHLASHTSGLAREPSDVRAMVTGPIEVWEDRVIQSLEQTSFEDAPGARYQYSNIGFGALGLALSRAAGVPFMELVEREVFIPLGMTSSSFVVVGAELEPRLAMGYVNSEDGGIDGDTPAREHRGRGYKVPNGGVYSTVADLARFLGAVAGVPGRVRILSEELRSEMVAVQTPERPDRGYGLGLSVTTDAAGETVVGHGGSVAGYTAHMAVDPNTRIGVVLLRNYQRGETNLGEASRALISELGALARAGDGLPSPER